MTSITKPRVPSQRRPTRLSAELRKKAASFLQMSDREADPGDTLRAIHLSLALKRARRKKLN